MRPVLFLAALMALAPVLAPAAHALTYDTMPTTNADGSPRFSDPDEKNLTTQNNDQGSTTTLRTGEGSSFSFSVGRSSENRPGFPGYGGTAPWR